MPGSVSCSFPYLYRLVCNAAGAFLGTGGLEKDHRFPPHVAATGHHLDDPVRDARGVTARCVQRPPAGSWYEVFPSLLCFGFVTLTTVGFAEMTPATPLARFLALMEAITGQFYMAVLVAGLVGSVLSNRQTRRRLRVTRAGVSDPVERATPVASAGTSLGVVRLGHFECIQTAPGTPTLSVRMIGRGI